MKGILSICLFLVLVAIIFGQKASGQGGTAGQDAERERVYQDSIRRSRDEERAAVSKPRSTLPPINRTFSKEDLAKLQPRAEDKAQYANFLKQSKTGIFKIFPFLNCDRRLIDVNDEKCLNAIQAFGNGSFYSFVKENHLTGRWAEIFLLEDSLRISPNPQLLGIIKELGDVALDNLDENSPQFNEIRNFQPPDSANEVFGKGNSLPYKAAVKVGNIYALRLMHFPMA